MADDASLLVPLVRLMLKALVIMILHHLATVGALLALLEQPTPEMQQLRALLTEQGCFPTRRTWERRLHALPSTLPGLDPVRWLLHSFGERGIGSPEGACRARTHAAAEG